MIVANGALIEIFGRNESIVLLIDHFDFAVLKRQFEEGYNLIIHKLCGDRSAAHIGEFFLDKANVLRGLDNPDLILAAFGLDRDDVVTAAVVYADIKLVDLDLADAFDGRPEVILEAVGRQAKEGVDQAVVADNSEKRLFIVECIRPNDLGRGIGNVDPYKVVARKDAIDLYEREAVL